MKNWFFFLLFLIFLLACSTKQNQTKHVEMDHLKSSFVGQQIKGDWLQKGKKCTKQGLKCELLSETTKWSFNDYEVKQGRFSHTCQYREDTIYVGGRPIAILPLHNDTLVCHMISENEYILLVRL